MAHIVNMHETKTTLSRLVEQALAGEEVVVARDGKPATPRRPGRLKGQVRMAEDFDRTPEDLLDAFEGNAPL